MQPRKTKQCYPQTLDAIRQRDAIFQFFRANYFNMINNLSQTASNWNKEFAFIIAKQLLFLHFLFSLSMALLHIKASFPTNLC